MISILLQDYLRSRNLYNTELADKLGYDPKIVGHWVNGRHVPMWFAANCILSLFMVEIHDPTDQKKLTEAFWYLWSFDNKARKISSLEEIENEDD